LEALSPVDPSGGEVVHAQHDVRRGFEEVEHLRLVVLRIQGEQHPLVSQSRQKELELTV
jgi:hypothetical protein